jgi:hypothetical protein
MVDYGVRIRKLEVGIARDFLKIGRLLCEARDIGWFGDFETFEEWVNASCGFGYRKGQTLMSIVEVQESLCIPDKALTAVGWSKLGRLGSSLDEGWAKTLAWAEKNSYNVVDQRVKDCPAGERLEAQVQSPPNSGDVAKRTLSFTREQRAIFDEVVDIARVKFEAPNREMALMQVLRLVKPLL